MTQELPPPGSKTPDDYSYLSRRFVDHARQELARGHRLQASEKVWGAANQALKAVAARRGWRHDGQRNVYAIARQLAAEQQRPDYSGKLMEARGIHFNFYENDLEYDQIEEGINSVEQYLSDLEALRAAGSRPFTISNEMDQRRIRRLTGRTYAIGTHSETGFSQAPPPSDDSPDADGGGPNPGDGGGRTPAVPPGPGGQPSGEGRRLRPSEEEGGTIDVQLRPGQSLLGEGPEQLEQETSRSGRSSGSFRRRRAEYSPPKINIRI